MRKTILAVLAFALMSTFAVAQASDGKFIKVDLTVTENPDMEPVTIKLSVPIEMVKTVSPNITEALEHVEQTNQEVDLRAIWKEIRAAGPNEYVNITHDEGHVSVSTDDNFVTISVDMGDEGNFKAKLPMELGDLFLGGEGEVNVDEILAALANWEGDLVTITGTKVSGHVWVE